MNVKFRMPKFRKMNSARGVIREMLMTIIATSISIVLTFGTGMWLDYRQKVKDSRQMAMMVIHDMDNSIQMFKDEANREKNEYLVVNYVSDHLDQIELMSADTLERVWDFLVGYEQLYLDDSNERIFNSSQETWKILDNPTFISLVQTFYSERRHCFSTFEKEINFRKPLTAEVERELQIQAYGTFYNVAKAPELLRKVLSDKNVKYYIDWSTGRVRFYENVSASWQEASDRAKFLMNISDEELSEFVALKDQRGELVKEKDLYGEWECTSTKGDNTERIIFNRDHTFSHQVTSHYKSSIWQGDLLRRHSYTGKWELAGDSLIRDYDAGDRYELDFSQITYTEEVKDSVERLMAKTQKSIVEANERSKTRSSIGRRANAASIDKSGNKIELARTELEDNGKETTKTAYMTRVRH